MLRNLETSIHCFGQPMRAIFQGSSLTTIDCERSGFNAIKIRDAPGKASYGVIQKWRALGPKGHMLGRMLRSWCTLHRPAMLGCLWMAVLLGSLSWLDFLDGGIFLIATFAARSDQQPSASSARS